MTTAEDTCRAIDIIDKNAWEMASAVLESSERRSALSSIAREQRRQLRELAIKLRDLNAVEYSRRSDQISEALLDLKFVEAGQGGVSLRLNQRMRG